jgi:hypothetical protein
MFEDDDPIGIVLPMLRMERDEEQGYVREAVTTKRFYIERGKYCAAMLANAWLDERVRVVKVALPDLDEAGFPLNAIVMSGAAKTFQETCQILNHNFWVEYKRRPLIAHKNQLQEITWGYDIPPIGVCDVLGYRSTTAAWLVTHPQGPALLTKEGDPNAEEDINKFLLHWAQCEDVPDHWWQKHEGPELMVDSCLLPTLSIQRPRKPMVNGVRRFLGLGR